MSWTTGDIDFSAEATTDLGATIGGVWLLQQAAAAGSNYLSNMRTGFSNVDSAVGFGLRYPLDTACDANGDLITSSSGLLDRHAQNVLTVNSEQTKSLKYSLRPIAGQYTPAAWIAAMPAALLYTASGNTCVHPCYNSAVTHDHDGLGSHSHAIGEPNDIYEGFWRRHIQQVLAWRTSGGYQDLIPFFHGTYYSKDYSEYYYGPEVQAANYSAAQHRAAHLRLATILHEELPNEMAAEWASTGHGPMVGNWATGGGGGSNPFIEAMSDHLVGLYGSGSDRIYFSYNGWDDAGIAGAGAGQPNVEFDKQYAVRERAVRAGDLRLELQDILSGPTNNFPWTTAFEWALGGSNDIIGSYSGSRPPVRSLGKNFQGSGDNYLQNGVFPIEIYLARALNTGPGTPAENMAQIEPLAQAFRTHINALT